MPLVRFLCVAACRHAAVTGYEDLNQLSPLSQQQQQQQHQQQLQQQQQQARASQFYLTASNSATRGRISKVLFSLTPALFAACSSGHDDIVRMLLHYGADPLEQDSSTHRSALFVAGSAGAVRLLLEAGSSVSATLPDRTTPLHVAAAAGRVDVCAELIRNGAPVNAVNLNGNTPLLSAVKRGHVDVTRLLLDLGKADPCLANLNGYRRCS